MAQMRTVRLEAAVLLILLLLLTGSCKRETQNGAGALSASLIFDNASPELREALTSRVDFRINDDNFARWAEAQSNLEELPRSAIRPVFSIRGSAVDRAVRRLESSPPARRAIESAGLSVREYVLETIALAQATEAAQTGRSMSPVGRIEAEIQMRLDEAQHEVETRLAEAEMRREEAENAAEMRSIGALPAQKSSARRRSR